MQNRLLSAKATLPDYDRAALAARMVHLGFGAFHRAHQGVYTDILAAEQHSDWGYYEVNLIGGEQQIADLKQQDNLYTVAEMSADAWTARVVGVVKAALHVQVDGLERVLAAMCEPQIAIVSLTITEKGYCHSPATGQLLLEHPMIAADLQNPHQPLCEPFRQWVIEDTFVAGRPQWENAGATLVADVVPFEEMKLRMLNGSHSFLAYLGYLAGYQHINDCMDDDNYRLTAQALMLREQAPTLKVQGVDLQRYADQLIARYRNPALRHHTWQIAMDGSQKLPQRMLDSVRWHLANHSDFDLLALGVAGWMRYVGGVDEQGKAIDVSDPLLPVIQRAVANSEEGASRVKALLGMAEIFGNDLPQAARFTQKVQEAYDSLLTYGAKASVAKYAERLK
ncbi:TPA_asm: mannitol dehydrogenase family protein [Salmonella enterica subsp. enterica serovar Typhi str. CT18]|uniref:Mannitol dehydrogenase family protein n=1 Tax=Salmonella enterica subsp. enterica serovar Typhi str. CT18 TaxID=220341 RepID=A0A718GDS7_SALTI|nr:mannitol dehydrogenase family protein [Salmonella enterica subsp. enterica serovar Typhi str. CT18]HAD6439549.1 mannitol dehydrogenase family protein [Salmonella enterica subsp. enterica serovar Typhi str. CT18]